jgi:succinoglycan biosynthesis protein ExoU
MDRADICVVIPARNAEATVGRAVASALAQPQAREVFLVDDGSADATAEAARACDDGTRRLSVIRLPASGGPAAARNLAIAASRAPWICPLDADDYFRPDRLRRLCAQAEDCDLVADDLLRIADGAPETAARPMIGARLALPTELSLAMFVRANISRPGLPRAELGFLKPLIRRDFLKSHGLAYDERLRLGEDFILYARALAAGARFRVVEACGYVAVERPDSISGRHGASELRNLVAASEALDGLPLTPEQAAAVREHRRHVAAKLALRDFLDAKRDSGLIGAAAVLARTPGAAPYVVGTVAGDVIRRRALRKAAAATA